MLKLDEFLSMRGTIEVALDADLINLAAGRAASVGYFTYDLLHYNSDLDGGTDSTAVVPTGPYIVAEAMLNDLHPQTALFRADKYYILLDKLARQLFFPDLGSTALVSYVPAKSLYKLAAYLLLQNVNMMPISDDVRQKRYSVFDRLAAMDSVLMRFSDIVVAGLLKDLYIEGFFQMALFVRELLKQASLAEVAKDITAFKDAVEQQLPSGGVYTTDDPTYQQFLVDFFPKFTAIFKRYSKPISYDMYLYFMYRVLGSAFLPERVIVSHWEHTSWLAAFADVLPIFLKNNVNLKTIPLLTSLEDNGIVFESLHEGLIRSSVAYIDPYQRNRGANLEPWFFYNPFTLSNWWADVQDYTMHYMQATNFTDDSYYNRCNFYIERPLATKKATTSYVYFASTKNDDVLDKAFVSHPFPIMLVIPLEDGKVTYIPDASFYLQIQTLFLAHFPYAAYDSQEYVVSPYRYETITSSYPYSSLLYAPLKLLPEVSVLNVSHPVVVWGTRDFTPGHEHFAIRRVHLDICEDATSSTSIEAKVFVPDVITYPAPQIFVRSEYEIRMAEIYLVTIAASSKTSEYAPVDRSIPAITNYADIQKEYKDISYDKRRPALTFALRQIVFYIESLLKSVVIHAGTKWFRPSQYFDYVKNFKSLNKSFRQKLAPQDRLEVRGCFFKTSPSLAYSWDSLAWLVGHLHDLAENGVHLKMLLHSDHVSLSAYYTHRQASVKDPFIIDSAPFATFTIPVVSHPSSDVNEVSAEILRVVDWFWYVNRFILHWTSPEAYGISPALLKEVSVNFMEVSFAHVLQDYYTFISFGNTVVFWDKVRDYIVHANMNLEMKDYTLKVFQYGTSTLLPNMYTIPGTLNTLSEDFLQQVQLLLEP